MFILRNKSFNCPDYLYISADSEGFFLKKDFSLIGEYTIILSVY